MHIEFSEMFGQRYRHQSVRALFVQFSLISVFFATWVSPIQASPDMLPDAVKFGAKDCGYCHASSTGGEALKDRGTWLKNELSERSETKIDVDWLLERENDETEATIDTQSTPDLDEEIKTTGSDEKINYKEREFDYSSRHGEWPAYAGDLKATKYSPLSQVNEDNVSKLQIAWRWTSKIDTGLFDPKNSKRPPDFSKATPLMIDGRLFVRTRYSTISAIDAATGDDIWSFDPGTKDGPIPPMFGFSTRGVAYYREADIARIFLVTSDGWLIALDAQSGKVIKSFGVDGRVNLRNGLRRPLDPKYTSWSNAPTVCGEVVVVGSQSDDNSHEARTGDDPTKWNLPLGDIRGFDVKTGKQLWVFHTVPQEEEFGTETWGNESWRWMGNTNVWSNASCDAELNLVYLPTSAPSHHFYGGERPGDNLFGTSIVALNATTGEREWHFQTVRHDIWDYDNPAAPIIADVTIENKPRKIVAVVTKTGFLFVLDRTNGEPIWEVEDVEVPPSSVASEQTAKTQPRPTWPPPFEMQGISGDDILDLSPQLRTLAESELKKYDYGELFTPPSTRGTVVVPGIGGGANWSGASFDPHLSWLFVASRRLPSVVRLSLTDSLNNDVIVQSQAEFRSLGGIPFVKPPWSSITAYDMETGEIRWHVPNGAGPKDHPLLRPLEIDEDLGKADQCPSLLVTPELIFYGFGDVVSQLRVMSKASGKLLWSLDLPGTVAGAHPITYELAGKQYIVIVTGAPTEPLRAIAFTLSDQSAESSDSDR